MSVRDFRVIVPPSCHLLQRNQHSDLPWHTIRNREETRRLLSLILTAMKGNRYMLICWVGVLLFGLLLLLLEKHANVVWGRQLKAAPNNHQQHPAPNNQQLHPLIPQHDPRTIQLKSHRPLIPKSDPRAVQLNSHHPLDPDFKQRSETLKSELTDDEWRAINTFSATLRQSHCRQDENSYQSLNRYVHSTFTLEERIKWMNPHRGVIRSLNQESNIPCDTAQYWVASGWWQSVPMWSHCCNQGAAVAKCPTPVQETPSKCSVPDALGDGSLCQSDGTLLCNEYVSHADDEDCLVYTFGIANQWNFEDWIGYKNCEVHAHDPTTKYREVHEAHQAKNVHFHYQGLGVPGKTTTHFTGYGQMGGPMMTLGELWRDHGHAASNRRISLLKIDCEGCEFEAFHQLATAEPEVVSQVCTIILEVHFSESLQMESAHHLKLMASFWQKYIEEFGFRFWYLHENPGAKFDQRVNPLLLDLGMDPTICCYEIALRRPECDVKASS
jgi:hypothetical protein